MILITGGAGYLGSHITRKLVRNGEPYRVLVRNYGAGETRSAAVGRKRRMGTRRCHPSRDPGGTHARRQDHHPHRRRGDRTRSIDLRANQHPGHAQRGESRPGGRRAALRQYLAARCGS